MPNRLTVTLTLFKRKLQALLDFIQLAFVFESIITFYFKK